MRQKIGERCRECQGKAAKGAEGEREGERGTK